MKKIALGVSPHLRHVVHDRFRLVVAVLQCLSGRLQRQLLRRVVDQSKGLYICDQVLVQLVVVLSGVRKYKLLELLFLFDYLYFYLLANVQKILQYHYLLRGPLRTRLDH